MKWRHDKSRGHDADALVAAAMVALGFGDRATALMALNDAAAKTSDPGKLHDIALLFWQQLGEVRRAEALLRRAADTGSVPAMSTLGVLLQQVNQAREAEVWLRNAARSGDADAINNLGNLLERQGDLAAAVESWRGAAEAGSTMAMSSLALALFTHGRRDQARQWCERALLLTATQERTDPAVLGKLELVSRGLNSGESMPERPFRSGRTAPDSPVRVTSAGDPLALVAALHAKFLAERDPGVLDTALQASGQAVAHAEPGSSGHAEALRIRGSLLRADYERCGTGLIRGVRAGDGQVGEVVQRRPVEDHSRRHRRCGQAPHRACQQGPVIL
jgi:TPR repeat protein